MRIAVIGAGLGGLSAAWRLHRSGFSVHLYDPAVPGGKARTIEPEPGWKIEWGPHSFTGRAESLFRLAAEAGLQPVATGENARTRYLKRGGRLHRAGPFALNWREIFELIPGLFRRANHWPEESVGTWVRTGLGPWLAAGPVAAMMKGIWAASPDEVEMNAGFPGLYSAVEEQGNLWKALRTMGGTGGTFSLPGGMGSLSGAIIHQVGTPKMERIVRISMVTGGWRVHTLNESHRYDGVVIATEAPEAARLLDTIPANPDEDPGSYSGLAASIQALSEVRYSPLLVAHWLSPNAAFPNAFGYLSADPGPILGTIFVSDLHPDRVPAGKRSFATMIGGTLLPGAIDADEQQLRTWLSDEHLRLCGQSCTVSNLICIRHPRAVALPSPGFSRRIAAIRSGLPPRIVLAGSYLGAGAMPDAIASGNAAADLLQKSLHAP